MTIALRANTGMSRPFVSFGRTGLWQHAPYFHNGSAPTRDAVVETYDAKKALGLTNAQKADLVQYLKSL